MGGPRLCRRTEGERWKKWGWGGLKVLKIKKGHRRLFCHLSCDYYSGEGGSNLTGSAFRNAFFGSQYSLQVADTENEGGVRIYLTASSFFWRTKSQIANKRRVDAGGVGGKVPPGNTHPGRKKTGSKFAQKRKQRGKVNKQSSQLFTIISKELVGEKSGGGLKVARIKNGKGQNNRLVRTALCGF